MLGALVKCCHDVLGDASGAYRMSLDIARQSADAPLHVLNQNGTFHDVRAAMRRLAYSEQLRSSKDRDYSLTDIG
jgi:hypothetical protein